MGIALGGCAAGGKAPVAKKDTTPTEDRAADRRAAFQAWVGSFRDEAARAGFSREILAVAFDPVQFQPSVIERDRSQPEFTRQIWDYLDAAVSDERVERGRHQLARHASAAQRAARTYGVREEIIAAIWGLETDYGANLGGFQVIDALATLGYDGRRPAFARRQLMAALKILSAGDIARERMIGSWAGAMGQTQFLPTSFLAYAVDADGDGRRDIWDSVADSLASAAHYLDESGWRSGQPWGTEVELPAEFDYGQAELSVRKSTDEWAVLGVSAVRREQLPQFETASVIVPAGARGPAFLVGPNFRAIMDYNASTSYALAVAHLADRIAGERGFVADWPRHVAALSRQQIEAMQRLLNQQGFDAGQPDGIVGPNTRSALRAFQRSKGLTADGFPTFALLEMLREAGS